MGKPLCVYSKVSASKNKDWRYDLRFFGQSIGEIIVKEDKQNHQDRIFLNVTEDKAKSNKKYFDINIFNGKIDRNSNLAQQFRIKFKQYFDKCSEIKTKSPEHRIESLILNEFAKTLRKQNKQLCNIQPIKLFDTFFQMPTPLKTSNHDPEYANHAGGGIDILAE